MTPAVRVASGLKLAMRPVAASSTTEPATTGTRPGAGPVTVNTAELMVDGSMRRPDGTLKVALMLALVQTPPALAAGWVDSTETLAGGTAVAAVAKVHT